MTAVGIRSINSNYIKLRHRLAQECEPHASLAGQVGVDEAYFAPKRIGGKHGKPAAKPPNDPTKKKISVFHKVSNISAGFRVLMTLPGVRPSHRQTAPRFARYWDAENRLT